MAAKRLNPLPIPSAGRPKDSLPGSVTTAYLLWPEHLQTLDAWAEHYDISKSEALRAIIECASPLGGRQANRTVRRAKVLRARLKEEYIAARNTPEIIAARRAARALEQRERRARVAKQA